MKGDVSRQTFDRARHFTTVRQQQGRVQLDADANEQADIARYRVETEAADVIGGCGGPLGAAGFAIVRDLAALDAAERARFEARFTPPFTLGDGDFVLTPGRYYVNGTLCEVEHAVPFTRQPDRPELDPLDVTQQGFTIVYLDVWQRHLTALDDPALRETALGGPDTATRTRTVWQVRTVFTGTAATTCADQPAAYLAEIASSTGRLRARAKREDSSADPCLIPASAGYRGLENQLYRVEIHQPGDAYDLTDAPGEQPVTAIAADQVVYAAGTWDVGQAVEVFRSATGSDPMEGWLTAVVANDAASKTLTLDRSLPDLGPGDAPRIRPVRATYKWSRDNGSVATIVTSASGRDLVVASLGPDEALGFAPGQWVELADELGELEARPGFLSEIAAVDRDSRTVTLRTDPPTLGGAVVKLRRWDGIGAVKTNRRGTAEPFVELESGVQISFDAGTHHTADHWLIPARTATAVAQSGTIEWPQEHGVPALQRPAGIHHDYCKLAVLKSNGTSVTSEDCRGLFPPLTQLTQLLYVGGAGQEARPGEEVPQLLEAGVFRGRHPVAGASVRFEADAGGALAADRASLPVGPQVSFTAVTGDDGIAACAWRPANDLGRLSQSVVSRLLDAGGDAIAQPLHFSAQLSVARAVAYEPGACPDLAAAGTVQQALDILCARRSADACCHVVRPGELIDDVIANLIARGERHICLCLEGGEHRLDKIVLDSEQIATLAIGSCGEGARVAVGELSLRELAAVALRNLELLLANGQPLLFDSCAEVTIEDCRVAQADKAGPVVAVANADLVRISCSVLAGQIGIDPAHPVEFLDGLLANTAHAEFALKSAELAEQLAAATADERADLAGRIQRSLRIGRLSTVEQRAYLDLAGVLRAEGPRATEILGALAKLRDAAALGGDAPVLALLDGRAETLVEDCQLFGALVLYGGAAQQTLDTQQLPALRRAQQEGLLDVRGLGTLHLRNVRLTRIALADEVIDACEAVVSGTPLSQGAFRTIHLADCEVAGEDTTIMAVDTTVTATDFVLDAKRNAGAVIADSVIVAATRALGDGVVLSVVASALAAAANVHIDVVRI